MIENFKAFEKKLGALLGFYNCRVCDQIVEWWLETIDENLDDESFDRACLECMKTQKRLPPINEFIELVKPSSESIRAYDDNQVWKGVVFHAQNSHPAIAAQYKKARSRFLGGLQPEHKYALERLGGLLALSGLSDSDLRWREKDFVTYIKLHRVQQQAGNLPQTQPVLEFVNDYSLPVSRGGDFDWSSKENQPVGKQNGNGFSRMSDLLS